MTPIPMPMYYDTQSEVFITRNIAFQKRTKDIEADYYFVCKKLSMRVISTPHMLLLDSLSDIFTINLIYVSYSAWDPSLAYLIYTL